MSEHPEEAHREALKRKDDYVPIGITPEEKETTLFNENMSSLELQTAFFKAVEGKSKKEKEKIHAEYCKMQSKILDREFKLADEGWLFNY